MTGSEPKRPEQPDEELAALQAEIDKVERDVLTHVQPGLWAMVIAVAAFLVLLAQVLPWIGADTGWQVLLGQVDDRQRIGALPRLFAGTSLLFGVLATSVTLATRRWGLAWVCAIGCAFSIVNGLWAVWSRQTSGFAGPGIGMVLALLAVVVLAVQWVRLAFARP